MWGIPQKSRNPKDRIRRMNGSEIRRMNGIKRHEIQFPESGNRKKKEKTREPGNPRKSRLVPASGGLEVQT